MKQWMFIFGLLDLGIVATDAMRIPGYFHSLTLQPMLGAACLLMMASLIASAVGCFRGERWAFYLNYVQFPVRLLLGFLSFSWLAMLILPSHPSIVLNEMVWGSAATLEGIRLGITIMIHTYGRASHPPVQWTGAAA